MTRDPEGGFLSLRDLESAAARKVSRPEWDYVQGGAEGERALRANRAALERRCLIPRVLTDVSRIEFSTTLLDAKVRLPYFVAPTAHHEFVDAEGEVATARAAGAAGVLAAFSTLSGRSLEDIARTSPEGPKWFQLYLQPEFSGSRELVERAERAGYRAIVLTVDMPVFAQRDALREDSFEVYSKAVLGNGPQIVAPPRAPIRTPSGVSLAPPASTSWSIVDDLLSITRLPVLVKGVLSADDAERAVSRGARGIVVSNHGGRQFDAAPAALDVLPQIARSIGSRAEVYVDGGFRRGSDILIGLALGARAVGLGRPILWALGAGGGSGLSRYFSLLEQEFATAMALLGCRRLSEIDASLLAPERP
jgi:4-hydroxymandelate oxidase